MKEAGRIFTSQKDREGIYNYKFSKGNALRKRRAYRQEEICLKFSQAGGTFKDLLIDLGAMFWEPLF